MNISISKCVLVLNAYKCLSGYFALKKVVVCCMFYTNIEQHFYYFPSSSVTTFFRVAVHHQPFPFGFLTQVYLFTWVRFAHSELLLQGAWNFIRILKKSDCMVVVMLITDSSKKWTIFTALTIYLPLVPFILASQFFLSSLV